MTRISTALRRFVSDSWAFLFDVSFEVEQNYCKRLPRLHDAVGYMYVLRV